jgi:hypothetical protein
VGKGDGDGDEEGEGEGKEVGVGKGDGDGDGEDETYGEGEMKGGVAGGTDTTFSFGFSTWSDLTRSIESGELIGFLCHKVTARG